MLTYIINMPQDINKRNKITKNLEKINIKPIIFEAIILPTPRNTALKIV